MLTFINMKKTFIIIVTILFALFVLKTSTDFLAKEFVIQYIKYVTENLNHVNENLNIVQEQPVVPRVLKVIPESPSSDKTDNTYTPWSERSITGKVVIVALILYKCIEILSDIGNNSVP